MRPLAERHGFSGVVAADHSQPWVPPQGQGPADRGAIDATMALVAFVASLSRRGPNGALRRCGTDTMARSWTTPCW
jgi:hypothetical protein